MHRRGFLGLLPALPWSLQARAGTPRRLQSRAASSQSSSTPRSRVEALVLGTAQDGGVPQINCFRDQCARVRAGEAPAPRVTSLGLLDHAAGRRILIDATPDLPAQLADLLAALPPPALEGRTVPLEGVLDGILLTHAHVGHYLGLAQLGKEVAAPRGLPLWVSPAMAAFLRDNGPWSALVDAGHVEIRELHAGETVSVSPGLEITPFEVVHRQEYSDTLGYLVRGPGRSLMYVPDADTWDGWTRPFEEILAASDVALLDGSFYSADELGHRFQGDVPHPPVSDTVRRLASVSNRPPVWFIHLNHTNPLWAPNAPERDGLPAGFDVARTGQRFAL